MPGSDLVGALVEDLEPVRRSPQWQRTTLVWYLASSLFVAIAVIATGPLRQGIAVELMGSPLFSLEVGLALSAGLTASWAGLELGVPGAPSASRLCGPPLLVFGAWMIVIGFGALHPGDPISMEGKRVSCFLETLVLSLPPFAAGLYLLRRRIFLARTPAGFLVGIAAASIPASWMYLACLVDPLHVLKFHASPILILGVLGALLARKVVLRS